MSIASEISRINGNIADAYTACDEKGAEMPQTRNSANLADTIESIRHGGCVTVINEDTVPESADWGDDIPETYGGETGEIGELALYLETLWYLSDVINVQGDYRYAWYAVATLTDLSYKMDYARNFSSDASINALHEGQVFTTENSVGVKSASAGTAGDKQTYTKEYVDRNFIREAITNYRLEGDTPIVHVNIDVQYDSPMKRAIPGQRFIYEQTGDLYEFVHKEYISGSMFDYTFKRIEKTENKVALLSSSSTDTQYPSAKCVYDALADKADVSDIPVKTSDLTNDSGFLTASSSAVTDRYTKSEVHQLVPMMRIYNGSVTSDNRYTFADIYPRTTEIIRRILSGEPLTGTLIYARESEFHSDVSTVEVFEQLSASSLAFKKLTLDTASVSLSGTEVTIVCKGHIFDPATSTTRSYSCTITKDVSDIVSFLDSAAFTLYEDT